METGAARHLILEVVENPMKIRKGGTTSLELARGSVTSTGSYESKKFVDAMTASDGRGLASPGRQNLRNGIARLAECSMHSVFELDPRRIISTGRATLQEELASV